MFKLATNNPRRKRDEAHVHYQLVVGNLMYAMVCTRLDVSIVVGVVVRHLSNPNKQHWTIVKCIMRYLQGTLT
jgi:hypothetical protein